MSTDLEYYRPENLEEVLTSYSVEELQYIASNRPDIILGWQELYRQNLFSHIVDAGFSDNLGRVLVSLIGLDQRVRNVFPKPCCNIWGSYEFLADQLNQCGINSRAAWFLFANPHLLDMNIIQLHSELLHNREFEEVAESILGRKVLYAEDLL